MKAPYSTVLLDRHNEIMGCLVARDKQYRFPRIDTVPEKYEKAVICFEDKRFYYHGGVDWLSLFRATVQNFKSEKVKSGASTISMQVIRMALGNPPRTIFEKIKEILMAIRLEISYSKAEILAIYASHAPFGGNTVGISAASLRYFNRNLSELSWAEAALLAVLPNAPSLIFPGKNSILLKHKRDRLLKKILDSGYIDKEEYGLAVDEPINGITYNDNRYAPHLLAKVNMKYEGQKIHSTIDKTLQCQIKSILERHINILKSNYIFNACVLVADVDNGEVLAYVGNSEAVKGSGGNDVDMITAPRSSGSILKPALYSLSLNAGCITPTMLLSDIPTKIADYAPANFNRKFCGVVPAKKALSHSLNIPFVRLLRSYSYSRFYDDLQNLGIKTITKGADHYGLSLILGGGETCLWDLCNMYAGFESVVKHYNAYDGSYFPGEYERLHFVMNDDVSIIDTASYCTSMSYSPLLSAASNYQTLTALRDVERPDMERGWKNYASALNLSWKTGTSFGFRDAWAVGVNSGYVIGVWVGNSSGEGRPGLVGVRCAAPILFEVASLLPSSNYLSMPVEEMQPFILCHDSGHPATDICPIKDTVYLCPKSVSIGPCPYHKLINVDKSGKWQVNSLCEIIDNMKIVPWFVLNPVQEMFYTKSNASYKKVPPFRKDCKIQSSDVMSFVYPEPGISVTVPIGFSKERGKVVLEVAHRIENAKLFWYVDDVYIGSTENIHQREVDIDAGFHRITVVDTDGNSITTKCQFVGK